MSETCAINGCQNAHFRVGLCESHYAVIAHEALKDAQPPSPEKKAVPVWRSALYVFNRVADGLVDGYRNIFQLEEKDMLQMHLEEAGHHIQNAAWPQAAQALERALQLAPQDPQTHLHLGVVYTAAGEFEKAVARLKRVQELEPTNKELDERMGEALCGLGHHAEAIEYLERAVAAAPDSAEHQYRLGTALEAAGRQLEAVTAFERAIAASPAESRYQQALGFVYEALGKHEPALRCFKKAIELDR